MTEFYETTPGFCPICGAILPYLQVHGNVVCYVCKKEFPPSIFGSMEVEYTIQFNSAIPTKKVVKTEEAEGPVVTRTCPKCGHNKMSYATAQLRSADEGQTVFYTCIKCRHKENENS